MVLQKSENKLWKIHGTDKVTSLLINEYSLLYCVWLLYCAQFALLCPVSHSIHISWKKWGCYNFRRVEISSISLKWTPQCVRQRTSHKAWGPDASRPAEQRRRSCALARPCRMWWRGRRCEATPDEALLVSGSCLWAAGTDTGSWSSLRWNTVIEIWFKPHH